jgi:predicted SAM-dependent methyltransferase
LSPRWFQTVETLPEELPLARASIERLGLRGINVGCARDLVSGWLNSDLVRIQELDGAESELGRLSRVNGDLYFLRHDATEPYPIESESFDWAFSEHFIEHITLSEAIAWLTEVHRILRPGGLVRITTPNLATFLRAYVDPDDPFYELNRDDLATTRRFAETEVPDRRGWMVNYIFYGWRHRWVYDFEEMRHALVSAGFDAASVMERSFGDGEVPEVAALDLPNRAIQTLYVEARRSG